jgi:hypothetical protein
MPVISARGTRRVPNGQPGRSSVPSATTIGRERWVTPGTIIAAITAKVGGWNPAGKLDQGVASVRQLVPS